MKVRVIPCGPPANLSEGIAVERLKSGLISIPGSMEWVLLTNLSFSVTHQLQSDEIDIVAIGPPGVRVIEVKHWSARWVQESADLVDKEADKLTMKARKIGSTLRKLVSSLNFVDGVFLITRQPPTDVEQISGEMVRGVKFHTLTQWKAAVGLEGPNKLTPAQVRTLSKSLAPNGGATVGDSLRRIASTRGSMPGDKKRPSCTCMTCPPPTTIRTQKQELGASSRRSTGCNDALGYRAS